MKDSIIYQVINSPENPYGINADRIQKEDALRKMREMMSEQPSNLEKVIDFTQYISSFE